MDEAKATATAIATARLFCSSGESPNLPVHVNAGTQAEACAAVAELKAQKAAQAVKEPGVAERVSDASWDGSPSRFTDEEYARSCVLDRGPSVSTVKERYSLPVREPDGTMNRNAVHAAAARISQMEAPAKVIAKAARTLVALYKLLDEDPPASLVKLAGGAAAAGAATGAAQQQKTEQRDLVGEVEERSAPEDAPPPRIVGNKLVGLIPYAVESRDLGGWKERIAPGALSEAAKDSLVATLNHDVSRLLGRYPTTLRTEERDEGLAWECELPNGPTGQDVREAVARGDLNGTSWRMVVGRDRWEGDLRVVEEIRELRDVAVVTHPAYPTNVELRSRPEPRPATEPAEREEDRAMETETEQVEETRSEEPGGGGLRVEERAAAPASENVEERILDAMRSVPKGEARDLTTADASAGPVTPPQLSTYLWDVLRDKAVVLASGVPTLETSNKTVKWPRLVSDVDVAFYDEGAPISESDPGFDEFEISPAAIKGLVLGSTEVFEDSSPDLLTLLRQNLEVVMALRLDKEALVGDGTGNGFVGMANVPGITTIDAAGSMDNYDLILRAFGALAGAHVTGPYAWVTHPWVETALALKKTLAAGGSITSNEPLPRPDGVPAPLTTTQIGRDSGAATSSILVYSPSHLRVVRRVAAEILVDRSAEFESDQIAVRGRVRACLFAPYPEAICLIENVPAPDPSGSED